MSVENEIVKFIAKIDLDPQDAQAFQDGLRSAEQASAELRESISETTRKMDEMRAKGQENSKEFAALERSLKSDIKHLKQSSKEAEKYSNALGINQMSMKQLRDHSKRLRSALDNLHHEANPTLWNKYQKELAATRKRMTELSQGSKSFGEVLSQAFKGVMPSLTAAGVAMSALGKVGDLLKRGFETAKSATQDFGDRWAVLMAGVNAGWQQFISNIFSGRHALKSSISEAVAAGRQAASLMDELFERSNSYKIMAADAQNYINEQQAIANDSTKSAKERMDALDNILAKEQELAETRKSMAQQELDAAKLTLQTRTELSDKDLEIAIDAYEQNREAFKMAEAYNAALKRKSSLENTLLFTGARNNENVLHFKEEIDKCNTVLANSSDEIQNYARILRQYNLGNDEMVTSYVDATLKLKAATNDVSAVEAGQARKRSALQKQIEDEKNPKGGGSGENKAVKAAEEAYKKELLSLKKSLLAKEITQKEFDRRSYELELEALEKKAAADKSKTVEYQTQLIDKKLALRNLEMKELEAAAKEEQNALKRQRVAGQLTQEEYDEKSAKSQEKLLADKKALLEKYGQDVTQIEGEILDAQLSAENRAIAVLQTAAAKRNLALKQQLLAGKLTREEYNEKIRHGEIADLEAEMAIRMQYGEDVTALEQRILDKRAEFGEKYIDLMNSSRTEIVKMLKGGGKEMSEAIRTYLSTIKDQVSEQDLIDAGEEIEKIKRQIDKALNDNVGREAKIDANARNFDLEMQDLDEMHDKQLISENEFQARKQALIQEYSRRNAEIQTESWSQALDVANQFLDKMSQISASCQEAETSMLEAEMNERLAAAGENAEQREAIEAEYEQKKLDVQKKYADIDMGINIAKAIASGALAAVMAWTAAGGNPVIAGIFTALIAASTAAEVATIIAQRNAIKSQTASSGSSTASSAPKAIGFSEGGYTGDGGRLEVAGVVHRGEYVVPQPVMRDPSVAAMVATIEAKRRRNTSRNALPGYAEGGYTQAVQNSAVSNGVLGDIYDILQVIASNPVPAYVMLSQMEVQQLRQSRAKAVTSLKRRG